MATPSEKLAESLEVLRDVQERHGAAIRSSDLSRTHRERLLSNGFLQEVMKGWYIPVRPDDGAGESTAWYATYWDFCAAYLEDRFGSEWSLSPEQSLLLQAGNHAVPPQLLVRSPRGGNKPTNLPYGTSLLEVRAALPGSGRTDQKDGLRLFSISAALVASGPRLFRQNPVDVRVALSMIRHASEVLGNLLEGGHSKVAGRLAGAFRNIGKDRIADEIIKTMQSAGYKVYEEDPFDDEPLTIVDTRERSTHVTRILLMWQDMRSEIIGRFPEARGRAGKTEQYLKHVDEVYVSDAYHSLSIEGYHVSPDLIERVRTGAWHPDNNADDREHRNALAARGYWQAFQAVKVSLVKVLSGKNPGMVADADHGEWYRELFAPSVTAGLLKPADLAGYRNGQVYIRQSMHVPPNHDAVRDCMPAFFELLSEESDPAVRIVLGHFVFVYIHPYMDGNGRVGRFLMNVMLAAGGYPWTVIPVEQRETYMSALEQASTRQNIVPFAEFLCELVRKGKANQRP